MTSLLTADQNAQLSQVLNDLVDTFPYPIILKKTAYTEAAFAADPTVTSYNLTAIRSLSPPTERGQFRNQFGPAAAGEYDLFIKWTDLDTAGLIDDDDLPLVDNNDLVEMDGEMHEIVAFGGTAEIGGASTYLQIRIKRRFADPHGATGE